MKNKLVKFGTAKLLKEKRFDVPTYDYYDSKGSHKIWPERMNANTTTSLYTIPTQSLVQGWLRVLHKLHISINPIVSGGFDGDIKWDFEIINIGEATLLSEISSEMIFDTYEQAFEAAIIECLNKIK